MADEGAKARLHTALNELSGPMGSVAAKAQHSLAATAHSLQEQAVSSGFLPPGSSAGELRERRL
jgi:uncharacterized membrane protein